MRLCPDSNTNPPNVPTAATVTRAYLAMEIAIRNDHWPSTRGIGRPDVVKQKEYTVLQNRDGPYNGAQEALIYDVQKKLGDVASGGSNGTRVGCHPSHRTFSVECS